MRRAHAVDIDWQPRLIATALAIGAAAIASACAGLVVGRATAGPGDPSPAALHTSPAVLATPAPATGPPARVVDGVPEGYDHTRDGALRAAIGFLRVEVSDLVAQPDAYRAAWREMCTPEYFASAGREAAESVIASQETNNHLISNAAGGQRIYERLFPLTASVIEYTDGAATVRSWSLIVAHPGDGPTVLSFAAGTMQLRWTGDWKLDGGSASASTADGASGSLRLSDGPALPAFLGDLTGLDDATPDH